MIGAGGWGTYRKTVGISGIVILASSACFLYCLDEALAMALGRWQWGSHVQPDAADGADFLLCQRREDAADDGRLAGW